MYITNNIDIAQIAENAGVDRIFVDMEFIGKSERQRGLDTVQSRHTSNDVKKMSKSLTKAELLTRINPMHSGTEAEIEGAISNGTDIIMFPMFRTAQEVRTFINTIGKRVNNILLLETAEAVENLSEILEIQGIDEIHIGLNDLHLSYKLDFMFELMVNDVVEKICEKVKKKKIPYGIGGIGRLGTGLLPAEYIIAEHYRLGSSAAILSRSFCNWEKFDNKNQINHIFKAGISDIRNYENKLKHEDDGFFAYNHSIVCEKVGDIVCEIKDKRK